MKPDFIGVGAQKCATSWINNILDHHPQIAVPKYESDKETRYFSCFYDRGYEWYERHFTCIEQEIISGEFSTSYFHSKDIPQRIYDYNPEAKILVCLREPISRVISNHKHELRMGHVSGDNRYLNNAIINNPMYVYQSLYCKHLKNWLEVFPRDQIHIMIYEEIVNDHETFIDKLCEFLGVDPIVDITVLEAKVNVSRISRNDSMTGVIKKLVHVCRSIGLGFMIDYMKASKVKNIVSNATTTDDMDEFMLMSGELNDELIKIFTPEVAGLEALLGRKFRCWSEYNNG